MSDDRCPLCDADLQDWEIPAASQHLYGGKTHGSRRIGIYDTARDRTVEWQCPDCGGRWPR